MLKLLLALMLSHMGQAPAPVPAPAPPAQAPSWHPANLPACIYEDGSAPADVLPCLWDASASGNGQGKSYWIDPSRVFHYQDGTTRQG